MSSSLTLISESGISHETSLLSAFPANVLHMGRRHAGGDSNSSAVNHDSARTYLLFFEFPRIVSERRREKTLQTFDLPSDRQLAVGE